MNKYASLSPESNQTHPPCEVSVLPRRLKSSELFGAAHEIIIEHHGKEYRLRVTSNDKLILTK
ncbi:hemin uptake protein HemP [Candidatus Methylospira mobilis]|uniref:Hemin uptake protein HemP n=1 Tax=Candidatus Methylospira mobilis TaxID=1808979 RepID=A0A5Q0BKD4_9GAMM|nr:hemin uptake protein HemP [Candidatus Methylospira mobilis]QFY44240.1 hemin uptake protein HemP [Candidatus Methylospira mobilis]WNV06331.1 hemin uptake protein HemP [Candidatus Methylospira mobilis]